MERLDFQQITVRSFYGQQHEGIAAPTLSPGINVVYGPNGQGKSTLARAIHGVLWPQCVKDFKPTYDASFKVGSDSWRLTMDHGVPAFQRDGQAADPLALPDAVYRDRFRLTLSDLLLEDGASFAGAIQKQASGGFDVRSAHKALGYSEKAFRPAKASKAASEASKALLATQAELNNLRNQEVSLKQLDAEVERAGTSAEDVVLYGALIDRSDAFAAAARAAQAVAAFPPVMKDVAGDTQERFENLTMAVALARQVAAKRQQELSDATRAQASHGWVGIAVPQPATLSQHKSSVEAAHHEVRSADKALAEASETERKARELLDENLQPESVIPAQGLGVVALFAKDTSRLKARDQEYAEQISILKNRLVDIQPADEDQLRAGIENLRTWLAHTYDEETRAPIIPPMPLWITALVLALGAVVAGVFWHLAALLLLIGAVVVAFVAFRLGTERENPNHPAKQAMTSFLALPLGVPSEWTRPVVEQRLTKLTTSLIEQRERKLWADRRDDVVRKRTELEAELADSEAKGRDIAKSLGARFETDPNELHLLTAQVLAWQEAAAVFAAKKSGLEKARLQYEAEIRSFRETTANLPIDAFRDVHGVAGAVSLIQNAVSDAAQLANSVHQLESQAAEVQAGTKRAEEDLRAFLERLGLSDADVAAVTRLCDLAPNFAQAKAQAEQAKALADSADGKVRSHQRFAEPHLHLSREELAEKLDVARQVADRRETTLADKTRIEERLASARKDNRLVKAIANKEEALRELRSEFERSADAVVGDALVRFVEQETRDQHLPEVFKRAREILSEITAGRYRLSFDQATRSFTAVDTVKDWTQNVDELSAGTRVQLLLAVRLAFAEKLEGSLRLPLLLDETLANSDDERANAIVEALLRLCRDGRQVFYFTAQNEEVAKWRRLSAENPDVDCQFIALPSGAAMGEVSLTAAPSEETTQSIPQPNGHDMASYADLVGVGPWSAWEPVSKLSLWYLLDEPAELFSCKKRGYHAWGQIDEALQRGTDLPLSDAAMQRARDRVEAIEAWQKAWRIGRGRRVDRSNLLDSGAVSDNFLDDLTALARRLDGDAEALVASLREGQVERFRTNKMDELETYLRLQGSISDDRVLSDVEVRQRVAEVVRSDAALDDALAVLDRIRSRAEAHLVARN